MPHKENHKSKQVKKTRFCICKLESTRRHGPFPNLSLISSLIAIQELKNKEPVVATKAFNNSRVPRKV